MAKEIIIDEKRNFEGIWIPKRLYQTNKFSPRTKFFIVEVKSLSKDGYCYAGDKHFSEFLGISERMVQNIIKELKEMEYIKTEYEYDGNTKAIIRRYLILTNKFYDEFYNEVGTEKKFNGGTEKKCGEKYNINTSNRYNSSSEMNDTDFDVEIIQKTTALTNNKMIINGINYYLETYKRKTKQKHPDVSKTALKDIIDNIQIVLQDVWEDVKNENGICRMIDRHFKTDYGKPIDYNLVHFGTEGILEKLARNCGLIIGYND